jgi:NAD(P)-dependent dehydrogenase (short-subunit alcohol dehydrogenase family)
VTANAIAPGFIVSDMTRASARGLGRDFDEYQRSAAQSIPSTLDVLRAHASDKCARRRE